MFRQKQTIDILQRAERRAKAAKQVTPSSLYERCDEMSDTTRLIDIDEEGKD